MSIVNKYRAVGAKIFCFFLLTFNIMGANLYVCNMHVLTDKLDGENRLHGQTVRNFVSVGAKIYCSYFTLWVGNWCILSSMSWTVKIDFTDRRYEISRRRREIFLIFLLIFYFMGGNLCILCLISWTVRIAFTDRRQSVKNSAEGRILMLKIGR